MAGNMPVKFEGELTSGMQERMIKTAHGDYLDPMMAQMTKMVLRGEDFPDYDEAFELMRMLDGAGIPYEKFAVPASAGIAVYYPDKDNAECSAVINAGSYGHEDGAIEIMGLVGDDDSETRGYLVAEDVFARIEDHFKSLEKNVEDASAKPVPVIDLVAIAAANREARKGEDKRPYLRIDRGDAVGSAKAEPANAKAADRQQLSANAAEAGEGLGDAAADRRQLSANAAGADGKRLDTYSASEFEDKFGASPESIGSFVSALRKEMFASARKDFADNMADDPDRMAEMLPKLLADGDSVYIGASYGGVNISVESTLAERMAVIESANKELMERAKAAKDLPEANSLWAAVGKMAAAMNSAEFSEAREYAERNPNEKSAGVYAKLKESAGEDKGADSGKQFGG